MKPEIKPSSRPQSSSWLLALLGIAGFAWFRAGLIAPIQHSKNSISPQAQPKKENKSTTQLSPPPPQVPPANGSQSNSCKCCHHKTPWWKTLLEVATFLAVAGYAIVTGYMLSQMKTQTKTGQDQLGLSTRAYVTIGKPDGTVAEIMWPNSPWQNYGKCASGDEVYGTGKRVPSAGESGDLVAG